MVIAGQSFTRRGATNLTPEVQCRFTFALKEISFSWANRFLQRTARWVKVSQAREFKRLWYLWCWK